MSNSSSRGMLVVSQVHLTTFRLFDATKPHVTNKYNQLLCDSTSGQYYIDAKRYIMERIAVTETGR